MNKVTFARRVGRNIRRTRQAVGLTKGALADLAGVHWTVIVAYEGGNGIPLLESFVVIATALGVSPCELLPGLEWDPKDERIAKATEFYTPPHRLRGLRLPQVDPLLTGE